MEILEKVAYLKGLAEGLGLDTEKREGKLLSVIIDVLEDMALEIRDMQEEQADLEDGLDAVSDDLSEVESYLYEEDEDDSGEEDDEEDGDEPVYETTCPNCEEEIFFDEDILADGCVQCPNCGEKLEFDLEDLSQEDEADEDDGE